MIYQYGGLSAPENNLTEYLSKDIRQSNYDYNILLEGTLNKW